MDYPVVGRDAGPVEDGDRRKLLNQIQVEIYAKAIDRAIERLNKLEENARSYTNHYRWRAIELGHYNTLYERFKVTLFEMREKGLLSDEQITARLKLHTAPDALKEYCEGEADPVVRESVGLEWRESRDFWRARLEQFFPDPASAIEVASADETRSGSAEGESAAPEGGDAQ